MNHTIFFIPFIAVILSLVLIPFLRKIALKVHHTDKPNFRKVHTNEVPLIGGIAVYISTILLANAFFSQQGQDADIVKSIFFPASALLFTGVLDDRFDIRASLRLAIQLILAHYIFNVGIRIESFYGFLGIFELEIWQQYIITMLVISGVVNAFNLIDGVDGLAGGLALVAVGVLAFIAYSNNHQNFCVLFLAIGGSLIAFLRFNFSRNQKIFMGDAGSMTLGFIISIASIALLPTTINDSKSTWILTGIVAILIIPVLDALRVFRKRLKAGLSPFHADRTHLHHLILFLGLKHKSITLLLTSATLCIIFIGFLINSWSGITWAIISMILIFYIGTTVLEFHHKIIHWSNKIKEMETKI